MKRLTLALALSLAALAAQAATFRAGPLEAREPWSRPAGAGTVGAGYLSLANRGAAQDTLVGVTTPVAGEVQIHHSSMAGGVMSMSRETTVALPAHGAVAFAPGGYHLMLMDLKRPLKTGDSFPAELAFASGRRLAVVFKVRTDPPSAGGADH
jgi:copper(I)-binding protein